MLRRLFGMFGYTKGNVSYSLLPKAEQARISHIFEELQKLNANSKPKILEASLRELGDLMAKYPLDKAPEIWRPAKAHAINIDCYLHPTYTAQRRT